MDAVILTIIIITDLAEGVKSIELSTNHERLSQPVMKIGDRLKNDDFLWKKYMIQWERTNY